MKLLKTKKIILLTTALGVLITAIVVPVILLNDEENNDQEQQNKKDVDEVIKILEAKSEDEKIITLPSNTKDKIIANNQAKIIEKLKTLIGTQNLKATKIEVSMGEDKNILVTKQEIIIKVSKGKYSKKVAPAKAYFVKREQNQQEIIADINSVKTTLTNLNSKALKLFIEKADKSINANKEAILNTLKQVEGYSEINFKDVKVKVKDDARNLPSSDESAINITFILSKGNVTPVEISIFTIKQLDSEEVQNIKTELNQLKSSLESLSPKIVEIDAPSSNKTITHNKGAIKNAIESLSGYDAIDFDETSLEIKDSNNNLPSNDQEAISIILILSKKGVDVEVQGFSAKQMLFSPTINNEIMTVKTILDGKTGDDLIISLPSNSTGNIIGKEANKNAIERKLRILIDPSNTNGVADHSSLKGTSIQVSMTSDTPISTTPQDIVVSISKTGGTTLRTRKTFQVKREFTTNEDIIAIKNILDAKTGNDLIISLPGDSSGNIIGKTANKNAIEKELRMLIDPSNTNGVANHPSLRGTTIEVSKSPDAPISTTPRDIVVSISKTGGTTLYTTSIFQVKREFTVNEDTMYIKRILDAKTGNDLIISLPSDSNGNIIGKTANKNAIEKELRMLIDPSNTNGVANHPSLRGTTIEISKNPDAPISTTPQNIVVSISKIGRTTLRTTKNFQVKKDFTVDEDIIAIKDILDAKTENDLIISLPSGSTGNIIGKIANKNAIKRKLRILIDPSNTNGIANHPSLRGTTIEISMDTDAPISTTPQNIIVSISKTGGTTLYTTSIFQVKRDFTADEDIEKIRYILDSKSRDNSRIFLPSDSSGNIIGKIANKNAIERKLRILIDPSNTNGVANHPSLRGTTIEISMDTDAPISTTPQNIIVSISKTGGTTLRTSTNLQVKKLSIIDEDILAIRNILESKTGSDLIITLPSDSTGRIIGKATNKNAIERKLRILIDPSNTNGDPDHPSLKGTRLNYWVRGYSDAPISTKPIGLIIWVSKPGGQDFYVEKNNFQVKKA